MIMTTVSFFRYRIMSVQATATDAMEATATGAVGKGSGTATVKLIVSEVPVLPTS